jgi:DNA-binding NarL/FixJ family response regulator
MNARTPTSTRTIRVLLISKYRIVQESLKLLLDSSRGLSVAGSYSFTDCNGNIAQLADADVAVVYVSAGDRVDVISELLDHMPGLRVVLIIESEDLDSQAEALKLGAVGIVHKEQNPKLLIEAIRQTYNGETWLNQVLLNKLLDKGRSTERVWSKNPSQGHLDSLTARELEVIAMIGEGLKNKSIAERLLISEATVRHHLSSIYGKLGVEDRLNLVIFAYQKGLIKLPDQSGIIPARPIQEAIQ